MEIRIKTQNNTENVLCPVVTAGNQRLVDTETSTVEAGGAAGFPVLAVATSLQQGALAQRLLADVDSQPGTH